MRITIEGAEYVLPSSLMDISLQQRIEYDDQYGRALSDKLRKIIDMKDQLLKDLELTDHMMQSACRTLSFFGKIPLDVVEKTDINQVIVVYDKLLKNFSEDSDFLNEEFQLQSEFHWNDEVWQIAPPVLNNNSQMTFGEFLTAKQAIKDLYEVGKEKWNALLSLCCVYFRKKGEEFSEALNDDEGDRRRLMQTLPLQYALHVGFFLSASMDSWLKTFLSSTLMEEEKQSQSSAGTLNSGNG